MEPLYGLKEPKQWYNMFDSFIMSQNFTRSEYDHCIYLISFNTIFIILVLYDDDMIFASQNMVDINRLKAQLDKMFLL